MFKIPNKKGILKTIVLSRSTFFFLFDSSPSFFCFASGSSSSSESESPFFFAASAAASSFFASSYKKLYTQSVRVVKLHIRKLQIYTNQNLEYLCTSGGIFEAKLRKHVSKILEKALLHLGLLRNVLDLHRHLHLNNKQGGSSNTKTLIDRNPNIGQQKGEGIDPIIP